MNPRVTTSMRSSMTSCTLLSARITPLTLTARYQITSADAKAITPAVPLERILFADALMPSKTGGITRGLIAGAIELRQVSLCPSAPSSPRASRTSGIRATSARKAIADAYSVSS